MNPCSGPGGLVDPARGVARVDLVEEQGHHELILIPPVALRGLASDPLQPEPDSLIQRPCADVRAVYAQVDSLQPVLFRFAQARGDQPAADPPPTVFRQQPDPQVPGVRGGRMPVRGDVAPADDPPPVECDELGNAFPDVPQNEFPGGLKRRRLEPIQILTFSRDAIQRLVESLDVLLANGGNPYHRLVPGSAPAGHPAARGSWTVMPAARAGAI